MKIPMLTLLVKKKGNYDAFQGVSQFLVLIVSNEIAMESSNIPEVSDRKVTPESLLLDISEN